MNLEEEHGRERRWNLRGALSGNLDLARIIRDRAGINLDREPVGKPWTVLLYIVC